MKQSNAVIALDFLESFMAVEWFREIWKAKQIRESIEIMNPLLVTADMMFFF